jgi:adenosylcobinamide-GDP ribazoletransferase
LNAFLTALSFLTRFPVRLNSNNDGAFDLSRSIIFFPVVGAIVGGVTAGIYWILKPFLPPTVLSIIVVALPIFFTGGIHFDGLMDTCDGIFSGRSRERSLEIMRDSRVGSMGVIAGILNVLLRCSLLIELPAAALPVVLVSQTATGRLVMSLALHFFPYARKDGLGHGFTENRKIGYVALASLLAIFIIYSMVGTAGIVIGLITIIVAMLIAAWVKGKIGGLTGDVYGALNEVSENIFLLLYLVACLNFNLCP